MTVLSEQASIPLVSNHGDVPAMLEALSGWGGDQVAGGEPPKWVAQQMSAACLYIAWAIRAGELP